MSSPVRKPFRTSAMTVAPQGVEPRFPGSRLRLRSRDVEVLDPPPRPGGLRGGAGITTPVWRERSSPTRAKTS